MKMSAEQFEDRVLAYFDGMLNEQERLRLLDELNVSEVNRRIFHEHKQLHSLLKKNGKMLAVPFAAHHMLAQMIPVLGKLNPSFLQPLHHGVVTTATQILTKTAVRWISAFGVSTALFVGGYFAVDKMNSSDNAMQGTVKQALTQPAAVTLSVDAPALPAVTEKATPPVSAAKEPAVTNEAPAAMPAQRDEEKAEPVEMNLTADRPVDRDINFLTAGVGTVMVPESDDHQPVVSTVDIRGFSLTSFPIPRFGEGFSLHVEGGMSNPFEGGNSPLAMQSLKQAYLLSLRYKLLNNLFVGLEFGRSGFVRRTTAYERISDGLESIARYRQTSPGMNVSYQFAQLHGSYVLNPQDLFFVQIVAGAGAVFEQKTMPVVSVGLSTGYWITPGINATLGMTFRGAWLQTLQDVTVPDGGGKPVAIINQGVVTSSFSSSVETRLGFGILLW